MQNNPTDYLKPRVVDVEVITPLRARVTLEPMERGFGYTLGNALRRVLLSSIPGFAITEVKIDGVVHEYSTIEGVQEDVVDILLNLKGVALKLHNKTETILVLNKSGEGIVTAGDFEVGHDAEIVNPNHIIANITKGGKLNLEVKVEMGRGYQPVPARQKSDGTGPEDKKPLHAICSRTKNVSGMPASTAQRANAIRHRFSAGTSISNGSMAKNVIMTLKAIQRLTCGSLCAVIAHG